MIELHLVDLYQENEMDARFVIIIIFVLIIGGFIISDFLPAKTKEIVVTQKNKSKYYSPPDLKTKTTESYVIVYTIECKFTDSKNNKIHVFRCSEYIYNCLKVNKNYRVKLKGLEIVKII